MALLLSTHVMRALSELRVQPTEKRIRGLVADRTVIDTVRAQIVWEPRRVVPTFAVPTTDLAAELVPSQAPAAEEHLVNMGQGPPVLDPRTPFTRHTCPGRSLTLVTAGRELEAAAFAPEDPDLADVVLVDFGAFDAWMEEDEELVGHPRDPFHRIDARRSTRRVTVGLDGMTVADSGSAVMLFETGLPTRYYLPREDVRTDLLRASTTRTTCAYKGHASYWDLVLPDRTVPDAAWTYEQPHHDAVPVGSLVCFYNERVDLTLDGTALPRPTTPWS